MKRKRKKPTRKDFTAQLKLRDALINPQNEQELELAETHKKKAMAEIKSHWSENTEYARRAYGTHAKRFRDEDGFIEGVDVTRTQPLDYKVINRDA